ncbi:MAG: spondin domain-containing protein [Pseudomonadota bacterium]
MPTKALALLLAMACAPPASAQETARYAVTVTLNWQGSEAQGHPVDKHWSRLIAFVHSARYALFADGDTASSGLALVATNGRVTVLEAELAEARRRDRVADQIVVPGIDSGVGRFDFEMEVSEKHRFISFATMLAPSPDWFTGVNAVELRENDMWVARSVPLWVWDAGADSGPDFSGPNMPTQPRQSVRLLAHPAFLTAEGLRPIGTARFEPVN